MATMATTAAPETATSKSLEQSVQPDLPDNLISGGPLAFLIQQTPSTILRPAAFFPAWSGVLTLAYVGYPDALVTAKLNINNNLPLNKENPGSRWPKTSLGCLKEGMRLTPEQLKTLITICTDMSGAFQRPQSKRSQAVLVDQLEVVLYECRSLERKLSKHVIPMKPEVEVAEPNQEEKGRVLSILSEVDQSDYWYHASRDGNREIHYRGIALGATLIHELACFTGRAQPLGILLSKSTSSTDVLMPASSTDKPVPASAPAPAGSAVSTGLPVKQIDVKAFSCALPGIIKAFRDRVDKELPGMYTWFADESLHITIRALIN